MVYIIYIKLIIQDIADQDIRSSNANIYEKIFNKFDIKKNKTIDYNGQLLNLRIQSSFDSIISLKQSN